MNSNCNSKAKFYITFLVVAICILWPATPASAQTRARTANPNATSAAQSVLAYLTQLSNSTARENRVIVGQMGAFGETASIKAARDILEKINFLGNKWPALTGVDYRNWDMNHAGDFSEPNQFLIEQWQAGALVMVSWHANNPWTGGPAQEWENAEGSGLPNNVRDLYDPPGSRVAHAIYMAMLDDIAEGLQQLEDAGVVVLWRPFHEMNGAWFWWHLQSKEEYIALWRHMFDYFTITRGLDNLLWVYAPNVRSDTGNRTAEYFYPGAAYVDIVGIDKFMALDEAQVELNRLGEYRSLLNLRKPFGITQFGPSPATAKADRPQYNYANLLRDIKTLYPKTIFFQAWEWHWAIGENDGVQELMNDPWVITRGELPKFQ